MNKDVIYIEPENDITDIITKIENAKERIIALVPQKNTELLHSIVNIKLLLKTASAAGKALVLVTSDASIIKLAAAHRIPITKDLKTAPHVPDTDVSISDKTTTNAEIIESATEQTISIPVTDNTKTDSEQPEADTRTDKITTPTPEKNPKTKFGAFIKKYQRWIIIGAASLLAIILIIIWALVIAPAVNIAVSVRTVSNNFSENITFVTKMEDEDAENGKLYLEERKTELPIQLEFKATGTKNVGEKATGKVEVSYYYNYDTKDEKINIPAGTTFKNSGLTYISTKAASISWDGSFNCNNEITNVEDKCLLSATVDVVASEPGARFNITAQASGWTTNLSGVQVSSTENFSGGTDKIVTVIQQSDFDKAKESLKTSNEAEMKARLLETIGDGYIIIDSSFKQTDGELVCTPKVDEEITEGTTPILKTTTTASIFVIDKTKIEEFISTKARLADDQKIYRLGDPFIENFLATDNIYTGKLKTSYATGPKVTEEDILNKSKGKKIGEVQSLLKSINGVGTVSIDKSFFWVGSVPDDPNKITINLTVEE